MRIIGYVCSHAGYPAADLAGELGFHYSSEVVLVRLPCLGRLDVFQILKDFRQGADAVFVAGCLEGNCHHHYGNFEAGKRVEQAKGILDSLGLDGRRVELFHVASNQGLRFKEVADIMIERARQFGPNPLGGSR